MVMQHLTDDLPQRLSPNAKGTNLTLSGTLAVTGAATFGSTVGITGDTTVGGTLAITGQVQAPNLKIQGLNLGTNGAALTPTDGMIHGAGSGDDLTIRAISAPSTYRQLNLDGSKLEIRYAGNAKLTFDGNSGTGGSLYPTFDGQANLGTNANKFAFVKTVEAFTTNQHTLGGSHNTSGAVTRGYMIANTASNTDATRTGYLAFHGQNGTRYGYIGNGAATLAITLENNAFIDASMPSNTANPMFRLTRQDGANNHLEMLGTGTVSKSHIGSLGDVMYLGANAYHNGTTWVADNSGRAAARVQLHAANGAGYIGLYATNSNNTPAAAEVARVDQDGVQIQSGFRLGLMTGGAEYAAHRLIWRGQINHGGNSGPLNGGHAGLYVVRIQQTSVSPYYNMALVLAARDGYNGSSSIVVAQTVTGTAHQLYAGGDVGLRWIDGSGGSGPSLHNASGQNLQITVYELAVNY